MVKRILRPEKKISGFSSGEKCCRYLTLRKRGREVSALKTL
jgi:hypothetical protein